jgi:DNA replication protein
MSDFEGFSGRSQIGIPSNFYTDVLPNIKDLYELKVLLVIFQLIDRSEAAIPYYLPDNVLSQYFPDEREHAESGIRLAVEHGYLLLTEIQVNDTLKQIGFLNTPKGSEAVKAIQNGEFRFSEDQIATPKLTRHQPNIFKIYEENIGVITPIIADHLRDLEKMYTPEWVSEAIQTAVKNSARSLRYIEVVLQNWQEEGKNVGTDRRRRKETSEQFDPEGYTDGEFSDFIDH